MFTVKQRDAARDHVLRLAEADGRVVSGAVVGAQANGGGDRWSDVDLTFGVAEGATVAEMLRDWTPRLEADLGAAYLFDLPYRTSLYRVFLLPGSLQLDLSFTPQADFGARGPRFELLFGEAREVEPAPVPGAHDLFGLAVHHAVRARFCLERGRVWQAEYWIGSARNEALTLACRRRGLETANGRGFDRLPAEVLAAFGEAIPRSLEPAELRRALAAAVSCLLAEADDVRPLAERLRPDLERLGAPAPD